MANVAGIGKLIGSRQATGGWRLAAAVGRAARILTLD